MSTNYGGSFTVRRDPDAMEALKMMFDAQPKHVVKLPCPGCKESIELTGWLKPQEPGKTTLELDPESRYKWAVHLLGHGPFIGPTYTPVNKYEECNACNYDDHACHFCGQGLDHEGREGRGTLHDTAYCRPDLVEHEPGPVCTWPDDPELNEYREPWCYWDHEKNELRD